MKDLDKTINDLYVVLPEYQCLTSIPGVVPVYTARILAEIVQIERFHDETKIAKYAGLYWRQNHSGNTEYEYTFISKRGDRYLRYYLVMAGNSTKNIIPPIKHITTMIF